MSKLEELMLQSKGDLNNRRMRGLSSFYINLFSASILNGQVYMDIDAWKMFVDPGLNRVVKWKVPTGEVWASVKVDMFNRVGFISRILENYVDRDSKYNKRDFTILTCDIQDFNGYNFSQNDNGSKNDGGDYMINSIAHKINIACSIFSNYMKSEYNVKQRNLNIVPARYGGDEFALLIEGKISPEHLDLFIDDIKSRVSEVFGYFKDNNGNIEVRNAKLKNDTINSFQMPENLEEQDIFIHFLKNNSLLDPDESREILDDFEGESVDIINKNTVVYPKNTKSNIDKLRWITSNNFSYKNIIDHMDVLDNHFKNTEHSDKALKFFERTMYNDIFQHKIIPYVDYVREVSRGHYSAISIFDVGFLKEINEKFNLARGDIMLQSFFQQILINLNQAGLDNVDFSRKGGTFFIGLKDASVPGLANLMSGIKKTINKGLIFKYKGETITLPCGSSYRLFKDDELRILKKRTSINDSQFKQSNHVISSKRSEAELIRYKNMCTYLAKNQILMRKVINLLNTKLKGQSKSSLSDKTTSTWNKEQFWVDALIGPTNLYSASSELEGEEKNDSLTDVIPVRYIDRCKVVKTVFSELSVADYVDQLDDIIELVDVLEIAISKMKNTKVITNYSSMSPSGSEEILTSSSGLEAKLEGEIA